MRAATLVDVAALKRKLDGDEALRQRLDPRRGDIGLVRVGGRRHADGEQSRVALALVRWKPRHEPIPCTLRAA